MIALKSSSCTKSGSLNPASFARVTISEVPVPKRSIYPAGSQLQTKVLAMSEPERVSADQWKGKSMKCKYFKMEVIENLKSETINEVTTRQVDTASKVTTDAYTNFKRLHEQVSKHRPVNVQKYPLPGPCPGCM
ncbi:transposase [Chitinophaga sp. XS-30]|nr:transposase [Chitinophaga sp. XS-30]